MLNKRLLWFAAIVVGLGLSVPLARHLDIQRAERPLPAATGSVAQRSDQAQLLADVRTLASPAMEGRLTGTPGHAMAQRYLLQRFQDLGLKPFGTSYVQPFSFTGKRDKTAYPNAANLVGFIPGTKSPERFMVISAHYDHLGVRDGKLHPGADDNASGVAAMLAIAAHFKAHPPRHSVVFAAFDAEELGLRGAEAFLAALPIPRQMLALNVNLDMLSHNQRDRIFVAGTAPYPQLRPYVAQAAARSNLNVHLGHDRAMWLWSGLENWNGSSDHGVFHAAGVPFLYFGIEDHADYHAPTDTFENINPAFFGKVSDLLVDVVTLLDADLARIAQEK